MDHVLGNIGTLYTHGNVEMFLLSESSTVFVLQPVSYVSNASGHVTCRVVT